MTLPARADAAIKLSRCTKNDALYAAKTSSAAPFEALYGSLPPRTSCSV